jgi:hypothetical protein
LIARELTTLSSTSTDSAAIGCSSVSNLILQWIDGGALRAVGGLNSSRIDPQNGDYQSITSLNKYFEIRGGTRIRSRRSGTPEIRFHTLTMKDANGKKTSFTFGSGITTGSARNGNSTRVTLPMLNVNINVTSSSSSLGQHFTFL